MNVLIIQAGLGPIGRLGFGASGEPASLANAPVAPAPQSTDTVLIQRAGALQQIPMARFMTTIPPQSAGYPAGGYWLTRQGRVELAPACDLSRETNDNLLITLRAMGRL